MASQQRTILITGAAGNLGTAVVQTLHEKGHMLYAVTGHTPLAPAQASLVKGEQSVDLSDEKKVTAFIHDLMTSHPGIDAAILLVGGYEMGGLDTTTTENIDQQIALNFKTAYNVVRSLLLHFTKQHSGEFILIGAKPAFDAKAGKDMIAYALSKNMVIHLGELINAWGRGKHIRATVIVPSIIDTEANRKSMPDADYSKWVKAENLAETIAFILSEAGSNMREGVIKMYNEA